MNIKKKCPSCGRWLDTTEYYKNKTKTDKLQVECKACANDRNRLNREEMKIKFEKGEVEAVKEKICTKCKTLKKAKDFHKNNSFRNGLSSWCKECFKDYIEERKKKK